MRCLPVEHDPMHRPALGRAATHHALDTVLGHELERAHRTALDRLPALDRQPERSRDEGELFEGAAAIRHLGRQRVVLALIREALVVEGFEDDIDLLLKERPVGLLVAQWGAERFYLARVVAATDAKDDAAAGEDVNGSEVLRQPQRVPHRSDIEAATDLDVFRSVREVQCHKDGVGNAFSAFALEVMLGHPETVVAKAIHERGHGLGLAQRSCEVGVRVTPLVDGRSGITDVVEVGMTGIEAVKLGDHREFSVPTSQAGLQDIELAIVSQGGMARMLEAPAHSSHALARCDAPSSILGFIRPRREMTACAASIPTSAWKSTGPCWRS